MQITPRGFRALLALQILMLVLSVSTVFLPSLVPAPLADAWESLPPPAWAQSVWLAAGALLLVLPLFVGQYIGLFLFRPWGRWLALVLTLVAWPLFPLMGPSVQSGVEMMLSDITAVLWGAVLASAWWGPSVAARFAAGAGAGAVATGSAD